MFYVVSAEPVMGLDRPREKIIDGRVRRVFQLASETHPIDMNGRAGLQPFSLQTEFDFVPIQDEGGLCRPCHAPLPVK